MSDRMSMNGVMMSNTKQWYCTQQVAPSALNLIAAIKISLKKGAIAPQCYCFQNRFQIKSDSHLMGSSISPLRHD